jgi:RNA polymerase sigma factor (sigma-70 family)
MSVYIMEQTLSTKPSLLMRIRDAQDASAWKRFVDLYSPFIYNLCRRRGLQPADAADVVQEVMRRVAVAISRFQYDPHVGSFRSWLFSITRTSLTDYLRRRHRQPVGSGRSSVLRLLEALPEPGETADDYEASWEQHLLDIAIQEIRGEFEPSTWAAFWATTVENRPAKHVAAELGRSLGAVYIARSRVTARLRDAVQEIDERVVY